MTVIFAIFFFLFVAGIVMHLAQHEKAPQFKEPSFLPSSNFDSQRETFAQLCSMMQLDKYVGPRNLSNGMLDQETHVQLSMARALMGGLSLSAADVNAGALSVVHAERGSLTIQDEQEPS